MKSLVGTKTAENLMKAFAGESQARNRYTFYASVAKSQGFIQISKIFTETAGQEKEHAEIFFKLLSESLNGQPVNIQADYPVSFYKETLDNLKAAAEGEHEEWAELYPHFAEVAKEEGFPEVANKFSSIAKIEKLHEDRYKLFLSNLEAGKIFKKDESVTWICSNCGHLHTGPVAPGKCPTCDHSQGYFEVFNLSL